jgi:cytochrome P450
MADVSDERFDPLAPRDQVPYGELDELRRRCPVSPTPSGYWYIAGHADVTAASRDVLTFEGSYVDTEGLEPDELFLPFIAEPRHGKVRRVINAAVAAHRLGRIEEPLRLLCEQLLEPIVARGSAELIASYVEPIPAAGIGYLLGLPDEDHPRFSRWADDLFKGTVLASPEEHEVRARAMADISEYLDAAIAARAGAEHAPDDFITRLVNTEVAGERLSHLACRTQLIFMLVAGTETTRNLIGNTILRLAHDPALWSTVKADPGHVPALVEESLRVDPPLTFLLRQCMNDATVGDVALPAGSRVAFGLAAANRDESVFEEPQMFSLGRDNARRHLAFGDGPHVCPGAALARLEARVAIASFVGAVTTLELEPDYEYRKTPVPFTNGPTTLPIRLS